MLGHRVAVPVVSMIVLAAAMSGCSGSDPGPQPPRALAVRCTGPTLGVADTSLGGSGNPVWGQPSPYRGVRGDPKLVSVRKRSDLGADMDVGDPRYTYEVDGWRLSRVEAATGRRVWSTTIPVPARVRRADPRPLGGMTTHPGYVTVTFQSDPRVRGADYVAAVDSAGRSGPVCALPPNITGAAGEDDPVELLPHAGVVIVYAREGHGPSGADDRWTDGYAVAGGKRLWAVPSTSDLQGNGDEPTVDHDTVYVWRDSADI